MSVVLTSILSFKKVEIDIYEKIDYLLYNFKSVFIYSIFWPKIYLRIANNSPKNINYFNIFNSEIIVVNDEFIFNLNFLIFEDRFLSI